MNLPEKSQIYGLASPIILGKDSTNIYLEDYFSDISIIDSVAIPQGFLGATQNNDKILTIKAVQEYLSPINELKIWIKGFAYSLILRNSPEKHYRFSCQIDTTLFTKKPRFTKSKFMKNTRFSKQIEVKLCGDMNNWDYKTAIPLTKKNENFEVSLPLSAGKYGYRLLVNGRIINDPSNKDSVQNSKSGYNSVLTIPAVNRNALPKLITQYADNQTVMIETLNSPDSIFVLWENFRIPAKPVNGVLQIKIPIQAGQVERSHLRVFAYNATGEANDLLIPLQNGKVIMNTAELSPTDNHANIFYFLPVERFLNGDTLSDVLPHNVVVPIHQKFKNGKKKINTKFITKTIIPSKSADYEGDLVGVLRKLEEGYFRNLGINTLWISPAIKKIKPQKPLIFKGRLINRKADKQATSSSFEMRIGNHLVLEQIIKEAHQQGLNVYLDIILDPNHQYLAKSPIKKRGNKKTKAKTMPQLLNPQPELIEAMTDSIVIWLKKFKIDGFRHDTTSFTNDIFERRLSQKIKQKIMLPEKRMICQVGAARDNRGDIYRFLSSGKQSTTLDTPLFSDARNTIASDSEPFSKISNSIQNTLDYFGSHHLLYNTSEKEGTPRFISYFTNVLTLENENTGIPSKKLMQLHALYATLPGIPSVYFADEIGRSEAENYNYGGMKFVNLSKNELLMKQITEKLLKIRRSNMALLYGDLELLQADEKTLAYSRSYFDKSVLVLYNKDGIEKSISINLPKNIKTENLKAEFGNTIRIEYQQISITLAPNSFEVLTN